MSLPIRDHCCVYITAKCSVCDGSHILDERFEGRRSSVKVRNFLNGCGHAKSAKHDASQDFFLRGKRGNKAFYSIMKHVLIKLSAAYAAE
jgi:hypothetical protein